MQTNKKRFILIIPLLSMFILFGCQIPKGPVKVVFPPEPTTAPPSGSAARRFQESAPKAQTAVESAVELSEKYARLSEQAAALRKQNQDLIAENGRVKEMLDSSQEQLRQTQKELAEANDLLIEMRIELNNWKTNVIGFRDEMRDAEKAQLEALFKILNVLGAKVKPEAAQGQNQLSLEQSPQQLSQARTKEILTSGLSNE
jgi:chromosome segregation ATPase